MAEPESTESSEIPDETSSGLDESDLREIEDDLFDLEDELIEMQGTNVRKVDETEESREIDQVYTYQRSDEAAPASSDSSSKSDRRRSSEDLLEKLNQFQADLENLDEVQSGQLIAADLRDDQPIFESGIYTVTNPSKNRIFAARRGQVIWKGTKAHVLPLRRIERDVDSDVGDVRYDGSVFIDGSVADGRVVEATGNIWVMGSVGRSSLNANGDVVVSKGIKGNTERVIEAHGNVFAQFIENASIKAGQNIIVEEAIMHSQVSAGECIFLIGNPGFLAGGSAQAGQTVYARELGSKNSPETIVRMGADSALQNELQELQKQRKELAEEETEYSHNVDNLQQKKEEGELSPKDEDRLRNLQFELNHVRQDLQETKARMERIRDKLEGEVDQEILVEGTLYPGVVLQISEARKEISRDKARTAVTFQDGEITFDSFHDPDVDIELQTSIDPDENYMEETHEVPPLDKLRRHLVYVEEDPLFDREDQLKRLMGLEGSTNIALLDVTDQKKGKSVLKNYNGKPDDHDETAGDEEDEEDQSRKVWWAIEVKEDETERDVELHFSSMHKDSVKVKCSTPQEGVNEALEYFNAEPDEIAVQILEEGRSGILGIGQKDYLIRVKKKDAIQREQDGSGLQNEDLMGDIGEEDVAGFINLVNSDDGLMLTVYPPEGHGLPVTVDQVEEKLEEQGFDQEIDHEAIEEAVEEAEGEEVRIGPRQRDPEVDGSFNVEVNEDETKAYLTVMPPKPEGLPVKKEEVIQHLEEDGMNYDKEVVDEVFKEERFEERVVIASGSEPRHGEDGEIEFTTDLVVEDYADQTPDHDDDEESEEQVDHRQGEQIVDVKENEVLAEITPATQGEPGMTIYGEEIPSEPGEDVEIEAGDNVRRSGDGTQLISECDGRVVYENGKLKVEPVFIVDGDLGYETGNVTFDGVVIVKGKILDGFRVEAGERIEAESAGKAVLRSKGDVYLKNGMAGKEEGKIEAEGNVYAKYLENATVESGGSVVIGQTIMHSVVDATEYVFVREGRKGNIIGGKTRAGEAVSVKKLGSGMSSDTEIEVGIQPSVRDRIAGLEEEIETQKGKFEKVRLGLKGINQEIDEKGGKEYLSEEKKQKHNRLSNVAQAIKHKIQGLHGELKELRNQIEASEGGEVCVSESVFEGSKITIQTASLHVSDPSDHVRYVLDNGEVVEREYRDIDVEIPEPNVSI